MLKVRHSNYYQQKLKNNYFQPKVLLLAQPLNKMLSQDYNVLNLCGEVFSAPPTLSQPPLSSRKAGMASMLLSRQIDSTTRLCNPLLFYQVKFMQVNISSKIQCKVLRLMTLNHLTRNLKKKKTE